MKEFAFTLSVPADPAFRPLAAEAAGLYGETLGLAAGAARALAAAAQEAVDRTASAAAGNDVSVEIVRDADSMHVTIGSAEQAVVLSRALTSQA